VSDHIIRDLLIQRLSVRVGVSPEVIARKIWPGTQASEGQVSLPSGDRDMLEQTLVRLMLFDAKAVSFIRDLGMSWEFQKKDLEPLFEYLLIHGPDSFDDQGCPDEIRVAASRLMAQGDFPGDRKKALIDTVCRFKSLAIEEEIRRIQSELNEAELVQDRQKRNELLRAKQEMMVRKRDLRSHVMEALEWR
jgi:hypothetical protein